MDVRISLRLSGCRKGKLASKKRAVEIRRRAFAVSQSLTRHRS